MKNILLTIAYDGTNYHGWQAQPNGLSIQEEIEKSLKMLMGADIKIRGASRTDAGVHALGQRALFKAETKIPIGKIPYALNSLLPHDIVIINAEEASEDFHPQYDAKEKTYIYKILNSKFNNPIVKRYAHFEPLPLNIFNMQKATKLFVGTYDFKSFCAANTSVKETVRTINYANITKENDIVFLEINGTGFLYNMVRIIAGTLIDVGRGRLSPHDIVRIIEGKDRSLAGKTAPPQGLTLFDIKY